MWRAAPGYDARIVAVSLDGLKQAIHAYLVSTKMFEHGGGVWLAGYRDTLPGHMHRALAGKEVVDFTSGNFWQLMKFRATVLTYTDAQTIRTIDRCAGDFLFNTFLSPDIVLDRTNPESSEWWIESTPLESTGDVPVHFTVQTLLHQRMSDYLGIPSDELELSLFNWCVRSVGPDCGAGSFGTFSCQRISPPF